MRNRFPWLLMPSRGQKVILQGKSRDVCAFMLELKGDKEQARALNP